MLPCMQDRRGAWKTRILVALLALWAVGAVFSGPALVWLFWAESTGGTPLDVARARRIVDEQPALLSEIQALRDRAEDATTRVRCEELARQVGALWIRMEGAGWERTVAICFGYYWGGGETYRELLRWYPPAHVARIHAGRLRPGESWEELSAGWFWVIW